MKTNILTIFAFCFLTFTSCTKKKDEPSPASSTQAIDTSKTVVSGAYYVKYMLDGKNVESYDGVDGFNAESSTITSYTNQAQTASINHYRGGLSKFSATSGFRVNIGVEEIECPAPNDLEVFPKAFKVGTHKLKFLEAFQNAGPSYYIKYQNLTMNNGDLTTETYYPKEVDNSMLSITSVENIGAVEGQGEGDEKLLGTVIKGTISSVKLYEHDRKFIDGGKVIELKNVDFKILVTSVSSPK